MTSEALRRVAEGRNADLIPTPLLSADEFEDFVERLLSAHRFCAAPLVHVTRVERWGRKGDKQDGIDFEGDLSDGSTAAWQCKRQDALPVADVHKYVDDCTFEADKYFLTFSGEASSKAREAIQEHAGWRILDQRGLGRMLEDLPLHKRRQVLDDTWGPQWRRQFLQTPGEDAFVTIAQVLDARADETSLINDRGVLVGRRDELDALRRALSRSVDWPSVVVVAGAGGQGKSRILAQALEEAQRAAPGIPVLALAPGRRVDSEVLKELPHVPATLLCDDIHRDPDQLAPLLAYLRRVPGTQLVLGSRGQGIDPLRNVLFRAGFTTAQIEVVDVGRLSLKEARRMVADLAEGLTLPAGFIEYLATEARDAPYVAVVALNLARRGELKPGYIRLDNGIRDQVLARYEDVLIGSPEGFGPDVVRRFLATVAAVGTADLSDPDLLSSLSDHLGVRRADLLRLADALLQQGVLATTGAATRVVPEVLADQVLENEAVAFGTDSGFVSEVWAAFGGTDNWRLLTNLASLEWRLVGRGLPSVIGPIWSEIHEFIAKASLRTLQAFLGACSDLAFSHPGRLMETLLLVRQRLDRLTSNPEEIVEDELFVAAWGARPIQVRDVEELLPKPLAECARNEPALLETALDAIWAIARKDDRPTNQHSTHGLRVISDSLADLGRLPDLTFPSRIVDRVRTWLQSPGGADDVTTPLFALAPLLAKEGSRIRLADRHTIQFEPFLVDAGWARPIRNEIRDLLVEQALAGDARRAGQSAKLLTDTLRSPRGQFGLVVEQEAISAWETDDLDTLAALEVIADRTSSSVLRRLIRRGIEWQAQYGSIPTVTRGARQLLVNLDEREDDDLAEVLLPSHFITVPLQRDAHTDPFPDEDSESVTESALQRMERDAHAHRKLAVGVADTLWGSGVSDESVDRVARTLEEIALARQDHRDGLATLFEAVVFERPENVDRLIDEVVHARNPALDAQLHILLAGSLSATPEAAHARLAMIGTAREGVRLAAARMYYTCGPAERLAVRPLVDAGVNDESHLVRQEYLASYGPNLVSDVSSATKTLLSRGASSEAIERVLVDVWRIDEQWFAQRDENEASDVISLIAVSGESSWMTHHFLASLARNHLVLILESLASPDGLGRLPRHDVEQDLIEEVRSQPMVVADWLTNQITSGSDPGRLGSVVEYISGDEFHAPLGEAIADQVPRLTGKHVDDLLQTLANVHSWAAVCPPLARAILTADRDGGTHSQAEVAAAISDGTTPHHWIGSGGESTELNGALAANEKAAAVETDHHLRAIYERSAGHLRELISSERARFQDDDED